MGDRRKAPTIKDIAAEAGVSKSAVSRALLGQGEVSTEAREKIEAAADRLGYVANAMAAGLRSRTRTLGVVLRDINRPYYGALYSAMQRRAEERGYRLVTATSAGELDVASAIGALRSLISLQVDGLVIASAQLASEQIVPFIERIPIVVAGRMELEAVVPGVYCDDVDGGTLLAQHLLEAGHHRIAVGLVAAEYSLSQHVRGQAMIDTIRAAGADAVVLDISSDGEVRKVAEKVLEDDTITAMMCPTDMGVVDVLDELRVRGLSSPDALSLTGYDGLGALATPFLGLTTYRQPVDEIGARAIDLLVEGIEDPESRSSSAHIAVRGEFVPGRTVSRVVAPGVLR
jgi:DNA-binding LacI/PurR family transcriptional regulator